MKLFCFFKEKVYQEIIDVVGLGGSLERQHHNIKYTHMVIKETLRLFSPIQYIMRRTIEDFSLGMYHYLQKNKRKTTFIC